MPEKLIPIWCADGGGERAIGPKILERTITAELQAPMYELFSEGLIAGVSGGGINTALAAHPAKFTPQAAIDFYVDEGPKIFSTGFLEGVTDVFRVKFEGNYLAEALRKNMGETTINEVLCPVCIPVWNSSTNDPILYCEMDYSPLWLVARATSAVPSYIPTWGGLLDGGVYSSNPTLWALYRARQKYGMRAKFLIISVATSWPSEPVSAVPLHTAGELAWALPAIGMLATATPVAIEKFTPGLVGPDDIYIRWTLPDPGKNGPSPAFDDGSGKQTTALIRYWEEVIASRPDQIKAICDGIAACQ